MKNIIKTFGLISLMAAVTGANGAASRVSVTPSAARRLPSIAGWVVSGGTTTSSTSSSTSSSTFSDVECIDAYTGCLKGADVCGPNMEECTTNVLLHAKMPNCLSTLYQCSSAGVNSLFGTSSVTALSNIQSQNSHGEVTRYTYPTDGSVLGQMVIGAHLSNLLSTDQCVKKYTNCLKRDSVCGADFELCTTDSEFKKQSLNCASTLARCQSDGLIELFGSTNTSVYMAGSRIRTAIDEGAALAAVNAVATCYKVADQCILNACGSNPTRCIVDSSSVLAEIGEAIASGQVIPEEKLNSIVSTLTSRDIAGYLKNACLDTIGGNKYCYATFLGNGAMPTNAQLQDEDNRAEIFDEAYSARMNNSMKQKIQDLLDKFDTKAKNNCVDTIKSCAMRNCGSGIGSVCYSKVFGNANDNNVSGSANEKHINGQKTYGEIERGCAAIVNTDANCQYAAAATNNNMYTYQYTDNSVFSTLFPEYTSGFSDPIGVIATLDASLASSYNAAAIANMKKQCQTVALGCVKSMCGKDYTNCYRNRNDIIDGTYSTSSNKFNRSMNKMGGVLDYNIVIGLCMNTVKTSSVCEEHLKVATADWLEDEDKDTESWTDMSGNAYSTVRDAWWGANSITIKNNTTDGVLVACAISAEEASNKENCIEGDTMAPINNSCNGVMDADGCLYSERIVQGKSEYILDNGAKSLFQELLVDVEKEAQNIYNAKLTAEQNMCLANNNGGVKGKSDNGSTFMWAKLRSNKVPSNYASKGLSTNQFVESNDLYGSFCRAKITVMSDDKAIQDKLGGASVAYFAVGDPFTCGSWISQDKLKEISTVVADKAVKDAGKGSRADEVERRWWTIGSAAVAGIGAFAGMDSLQRNGKSLGGLLTTKNSYVTTEKKNEAGDNCLANLKKADDEYRKANSSPENSKARSDAIDAAARYANTALNYARGAGANVSGISFESLNGYIPATAAEYAWSSKELSDINTIKVRLSRYKNCKTPCQTQLSNVDIFLAEAPTSDEKGVGNTKLKVIKDAFEMAIEKIGEKSEDDDTALESLEDMSKEVKELTLSAIKTNGNNEKTLTEFADVQKSFKTNYNELMRVCTDLQSETEKRGGRLATNLGASVVASGLSALVAYNIVDDAQRIKYEKAENEAVKEWMDNVGSHIKCYLGGEELGSYGDVISFELN